MTSLKRIPFFLIFMSFLVGCSHTPTNSSQDKLSLDSVQATDWAHMDKKSIILLLGKPDIQSSLDKNEDAWIYLAGALPTTRLSLSFNTTSNQLTSVNWFADESNSSLKLLELQQKYPQMAFDLNNPVRSKGLHQMPMLFYTSKTKQLNASVYEDSKQVSSLEWYFDKTSNSEKRKPTSH